MEIGLKLFSFYLSYFSLDSKIFSERKVDFEQENSLNILLIALLSLFHNLYKIYFSFTQIYKSHFDTDTDNVITNIAKPMIITLPQDSLSLKPKKKPYFVFDLLPIDSKDNFNQ